MNLKKDVHIVQWESTPHIWNIIDILSVEELIPNRISWSNWEFFSDEIIEKLRRAVTSINPLKKVYLKIFVKQILIDEDRADRLLSIRLLSMLDDDDKILFKEIFKKKLSIERTLTDILDENLHLRRHSITGRDNYINWISNLQKIEKIYEWLRRWNKDLISHIKKINLKEINKGLDDLLRIPKKWKVLDIKMNLQTLVSSFIWRIDVFKNIVEKKEKNELINKFEERKKFKNKLSWYFLWTSIGIFVIISLINLVKSNPLNWWISSTKFVENLLWFNIYFLSIEILLLILAFYFLWLFKTYRKIVELYDSHILLIESDFFYKNDEHFNTIDNPKLFDLRKENTQKIHLLPEKVFDILHWKNEITTESPIINTISDTFSKIWEKK